MLSWRRMVLAGSGLLAALPLAALVASADAGTRQPSTAVGVSAREHRFALYRTDAPRGLVRFNLVNYGEDRHDLVVRDRDGRQLARSREVRAGERTTVTVRLAPGRYRLLCDLADHEWRGMRASFLVRRPRARR